MAAAYAALVSLSHILQQILRPPPTHHFIIPRQQIEYLREKVCFFIDFLENYSGSKDYENLERRIADAAYDAEDLIESEVVSQIRAKSAECGEKSFQRLCRGLERITKRLDSIERRLVKIKGKEGIANLQPEITARPLPSHKNAMVGFDDHLIEVMSALTTDESNRQVIPIVGMGGIGKTTLATNVYNNPCIIEHFHVRAWVTVSQEYTVRDILLRLLHQISNPNGRRGMRNNFTVFSTNMSQESDDQLGLSLYQKLFGKYLVVMDDMWSIQAWDKIKMFFPNNYTGSRILVTTRLLKLAVDFGSCRPYEMSLLDEKQSWDLVSEKAFAGERCPLELVKIGRRIAKRCRGLPLALVVIGGILAKSKRTRENWEYVNGNVIDALKSEDDEQCTRILSLSYNHLPMYLKPCFLYFASFPEDYEIDASKLIRLWVAEGFIKPTSDKSLEDIARAYLEDLIDRNLILVGKRGTSGKVKTISIHDLLGDLCWRKAHENKFLRVASLNDPNISPHLKSERRLSIYNSWRRKEVCRALRSATFNRSLLSHFEWDSEWVVRSYRLLRVLDVADRYSIDEIVKLTNSRYVACTMYWHDLPPDLSISPLWNLQTLVFYGQTPIGLDIWQMPQLRHLKINELRIGNPWHGQTDCQDIIVLENLQTLSTIKHFRCTEEVVARIPNVKKLGIAYDNMSDIYGPYFLINLVRFCKLESLSITGNQKLWGNNIAFPTSLKKLILSGCMIPWEDMSLVGSLPNLEVLKLRSHAARGSEWNPNEGEFCKLKFLMIGECELEIWGAEDTHFPRLEHLIIGQVRFKEIPLSFAEILTLKVIEIKFWHRVVRSRYHCWDHTSWDLRESAFIISEQREMLGYDGLQVFGGPLFNTGVRFNFDLDFSELFYTSNTCSLKNESSVHLLHGSISSALGLPTTRTQTPNQQPKFIRIRSKPQTRVRIQQPSPLGKKLKENRKNRRSLRHSKSQKEAPSSS